MVFSRELLPLMNRLHSTVPADAVPILNLDELIPIAAGMVGDTVFISEPLMDFRRHSRATTFTVTTADNAPEVRSSVNLRLANKRLTLAKQCKALSTLRDWVTEQNLDAWGDAQHWSRYTAYLDRTLRAAEARLAVHQSADRFSQAKSLVTALTSRAYRDPRRGGAGRHQILIDLLAILKPAASPPMDRNPTRRETSVRAYSARPMRRFPRSTPRRHAVQAASSARRTPTRRAGC